MKKIEDFKFPEEYKDIAKDFINYKRALGYKFSLPDQRKLKLMLNDIIINGDLELTQELVNTFAQRRNNESISYLHGRQSLIRQFALYLNLQGINAYVYPKKLVKTNDDFVPYIFTHDEIKSILKVVDNIESKPQGYINTCFIYPAIIRVLYACGLRIGEAVVLTRDQVDLDNGIITIMNGKNNVSRLVPMSNTLTKYLRLYDTKIVRKNNPYFFPALHNEHYSPTTISAKFKIFIKIASVHPLQNGKYPRLHDLRHTFSVYALEKMLEQGLDIYCSLPILSVYLGHKGIESTEKYLRLTKQYFQKILDMNKETAKKVFPEIKLYEK